MVRAAADNDMTRSLALISFITILNSISYFRGENRPTTAGDEFKVQMNHKQSVAERTYSVGTFLTAHQQKICHSSPCLYSSTTGITSSIGGDIRRNHWGGVSRFPLPTLSYTHSPSLCTLLLLPFFPLPNPITGSGDCYKRFQSSRTTNVKFCK